MGVEGPMGYRRIVDELHADIASGRRAEGDPLPSLRELAAQYGVSVDIARRALNALRAAGLVAARHGSGFTVRSFARITRVSPDRVARARWAAGSAIQDSDTAPRPRTVDVVVAEVPAPDFVAAALGVEPDALVLSRSRRFVVDERPVQFATSYLPVELARGTAIAYTDTGPGGIYARLDEAGYGPTHFTERVLARAPSTAEAKGLDLVEVETSMRIFEITRYAYAGERCVEVNRMILDTDAYELVYSIAA